MTTRRAGCPGGAVAAAIFLPRGGGVLLLKASRDRTAVWASRSCSAPVTAALLLVSLAPAGAVLRAEPPRVAHPSPLPA